MYRIISAKNISESDIYIDDLGRPLISSGATRELTSEYTQESLRNSEDLTELVNNDIIRLVIDGIEFSKEDSLNFFKDVIETNMDVYELSSSTADGIEELNQWFSNLSSNAEIEPLKLGTILFLNTSITENKWLKVSDSQMGSSDLTPFVFPFTADIRGLMYSNEVNGTYANIEIYKNGSLVYTWLITNSRWAVNSNLPHIEFLAGDKISMFLKKNSSGGKPNNVVIYCMYQIHEFSYVEFSSPT